MDDTLRLTTGADMPALGLGVFRCSPEETVDAVVTALRSGYRLIDTAAAYENERFVGEGLRSSGLPRDRVWIETKVWVTDYGADRTLHAFDKAARKLGVDTIDLLLLHKPVPERFDATIAAYHALERLHVEGRARAIGVSNFLPHHLEALMSRVDVVPSVNQVEWHPYFQSTDVRRANDAAGIVTQAWSPIGGITHYPGPWGDHRVNVLHDRTLGEIARSHGRTPAQVMLRWGLQQGRGVVPKSARPSRILENGDLAGFTLSDDELHRIDSLDRGIRNGTDPDAPSRFDRIIAED